MILKKHTITWNKKIYRAQIYIFKNFEGQKAFKWNSLLSFDIKINYFSE